MNINFKTISWEILDNYFKSNKNFLVNHHLRSYNNFFKNDIKDIFKTNNPISFYKNYPENNVKINETYVTNMNLKEYNEEVKMINKNEFKNQYYPNKSNFDVDELWNGYIKKNLNENKIEEKKVFLLEAKMYIAGRNGKKYKYGKPIIVENDIKKYMYPNEARLRNLTYSFSIFVDILIEFKIYKKKEDKKKNIVYYEQEISEELLKDINFGNFPIMVNSDLCILNLFNKYSRFSMGECINDQGGYFIIDGKEKVIVTQENIADNIVYVEKKKDKNFTCQSIIRSVSEDVTKPRRKLYIKIMAPGSGYKNGQIVVEIPNVKKPVSLFILMRALGVISDKEIIKYCLLDLKKYEMMIEYFRPSAHDVGYIYTQHSALNYIKSLIKLDRQTTNDYLLNILCNNLLPHLGERNFKAKALFIGYMVKKLLFVHLNLKKETNRDNYICKRFEVSGKMINELFSEYYKEQIKKIYLCYDKKYYYETDKNKYAEENFKTLFINYTRIGKDKYDKKLNNPILYIPKPSGNGHTILECNKIVQDGFKKAFKGNWGAHSHTKRIGVIQDLNRLSHWSAVCHLRKTNVPLPPGSDKIVSPRLLNSTQWGILCPVHSPDGGNIGLHKHFAMLTHITEGVPTYEVIKYLLKLEENYISLIEFNTITELAYKTKIIVNGNWFGVTNNPKDLIDVLKNKRRNGLLNPFISISWNIENKEIIIWSDIGRGCHPMIINKNYHNIFSFKKEKKFNWKNLLIGSNKKSNELNEIHDVENKPNIHIDGISCVIEYLDSQELECTKIISEINEEIISDESITHSEIDPSVILGVMANQVIFPSNNPYPRNAFSCGQSKQAVSMYHTNYQNRMDKTGLLLHYGQTPLIKSKYYERITNNKNPYGMNAIVAIMCYSGYNVEDAVIINGGSLKRGLFRTTYFSTYEAQTENKKSGYSMVENKFMKIDDENIQKIKMGYDYSLLDDNGLIRKNEKVNDKTILIGMVKKSSKEEDYIDESIFPKKGQLGYVEKTYMCEHNDGEMLAKVKIRHDRMPAIGDKFCSRAGQKGTIGIILNEEDMPFTENGLKPDIIVNPHAMPSRMTIGHLIEALLAKSCCLLGGFGDCTAFSNKGSKHEIFGNILKKNNFHSSGNEIMYNGMTGEQLETEIYIGPTYYERLKHMVKDKINYRSKGKRDALTRQTVGGRANDGGLRIGEMDRDAILSHGLASFLNQSMMERGDKYQMAICNKTGTIAIYNPINDIFLSPMLDGPIKFEFDLNDNPSVVPISKFGKDFSIVNVPYAFKLLYQELVTLNVQMRIITEDNVDKLTNHINPNHIFKITNKKLYDEKNKFDSNFNKYLKEIKYLKKKLNIEKIFKNGDEDLLPRIYDEDIPLYLNNNVEMGENDYNDKMVIVSGKREESFNLKTVSDTIKAKYKEKIKKITNIFKILFNSNKLFEYALFSEKEIVNVSKYNINGTICKNISFLIKRLCKEEQSIADFTPLIGYNSIAFLENFNKVFCIEENLNKIKMLEKNLEFKKKLLKIKSSKFKIFNKQFINIFNFIKKKTNIFFFDPPYESNKKIEFAEHKFNDKNMLELILTCKDLQDSLKYTFLKLPINYDIDTFKKKIKKKLENNKIKEYSIFYINNKKENKFSKKKESSSKCIIIFVKYNKFLVKNTPQTSTESSLNKSSMESSTEINDDETGTNSSNISSDDSDDGTNTTSMESSTTTNDDEIVANSSNISSDDSDSDSDIDSDETSQNGGSFKILNVIEKENNELLKNKDVVDNNSRKSVSFK